MAVEVLASLPLEEYLNTSYSPDREYRDGELLERNVGDWAHSRLQILLAHYIAGREALEGRGWHRAADQG